MNTAAVRATELFVAIFAVLLFCISDFEVAPIDLVDVGTGQGLVRPEEPPQVLSAVTEHSCANCDGPVTTQVVMEFDGKALQFPSMPADSENFIPNSPDRSVAVAISLPEPVRAALEELYAEGVRIHLVCETKKDDRRQR